MSNMSNKIFVGNIAYNATPEDLEAVFNKFGNIQEVKIIKDRVTGKSRGFAFLSFSSAEEAKSAASQMDGQELGGRKIRVNEAKEKQGQS